MNLTVLHSVFPRLVLSVLAQVLALVLATNLNAAGVTENTPPIYYTQLGTETVALVLTPTDISRYGANEITADDRFYRFSLQDEPQSQGRLAYIDGQWQGMLLRNGSVYLIDQIASDANSLTNRLNARALSEDFSLGQCGGLVHPQAKASSDLTVRSLLNPKAATIDFDSFCSELVDGVCIVAEVTMVFDSSFRTKFGASYQAQAVAIMEYVDLIYRTSFNISFNKLRMAYDSGDLFSTSTDSGTLLDDMAEKRYFDQTDAFDPNEQSIMHLVTGRNFDGDIIGLANGPLYTNYPTPDYPVLCTYVAIGTSQIFGSGSTSAAYTSLIVAHEIGHNFGFEHDGDPDFGAASCSSTDWIMGAELNLSSDDFSSCSHEALGPNMNAISNIEACFDYPVNLSITRDPSNPTNVDAEVAFSTQYTINSLTRSDQSTNLQITGSVVSSAATFTSASVDGTPCTRSNGNQTYTCAVTGASTHNLTLGIQSTFSNIAMTHQVFSTTANRFDVEQGNNLITEVITLPDTGVSDPEPTTETESRGGSGGGGGGSLNWLSLGLLALLFIRRKQIP